MRAFRTTSPPVAPIPRYALYDEPLHAVDARFIHVETIANRSAPRDWTIRSHAHHDLHQVLLIVEGGGTMHAESEQWRFGRQSLLIAPAGLVHGFGFDPDTSGHIVSFADGLARRFAAIEPDVALLLGEARLADIGRAAETLDRDLAALSVELARAAPMGEFAAAARLSLVLVEAARAIGTSAHETHAGPGREAELVARFRAQIEARLGQGWSAGTHARALGVSLSRLRAACAIAAGQSPIRLIQQRTLIEARRALAHGSAPVSSIAYALGFTDAAYFSRWFTRAEGRSPGAYRRTERGHQPQPLSRSG